MELPVAKDSFSSSTERLTWVSLKLSWGQSVSMEQSSPSLPAADTMTRRLQSQAWKKAEDPLPLDSGGHLVLKHFFM